MPTTSKLGAALGFQLGGSDTIVASALGIVTTPNTCLPYLTLDVSAAGLVTSKGSNSNFNVVGNSRLAAQLGFVLGSRLDLRAVAPQSVLGQVRTSSGLLTPSLSVVARGLARASGRSATSLDIIALGRVFALGSVNANVRLVGLQGLVTTLGAISAVDLGVVARGKAIAQGTIPTVVIDAHATAVGQARAIGFVDHQSLSVSAVGQVVTLGSCTIPISAGDKDCIIGPTGSSTPKVANFAL